MISLNNTITPTQVFALIFTLGFAVWLVFRPRPICDRSRDNRRLLTRTAPLATALALVMVLWPEVMGVLLMAVTLTAIVGVLRQTLRDFRESEAR